MAEFTATVRSLGEIDVVDAGGYLDAHTAPTLDGVLHDLAEKGRVKIVVNFAALDYISSAGLGVFMANIESIRGAKGDIKLVAMKQNVYNIFDLLGFPLLYDIFDTEDEAIAKYNNPEKDEK
jgi:anti-sigma B factor antagonist